MRLTKVISASEEFASEFDGKKYGVDKFPQQVVHHQSNSIIYLEEDPRFAWIVNAENVSPRDVVYWRELSVVDGIGQDGYFCFKRNTSSIVDLQSIDEMTMIVNARAGLPDALPDHAPSPVIVKEMPVENIDKYSIFRLSEGLEEMLLAQSPLVAYASIRGATAKAMLDDQSRGYFLGFEFRRNNAVSLIVRSVFETLSDVDFVLDTKPPYDNQQVLSFF